MSMPISKDCYTFMIEEDIKWLNNICPKGSLEKSHIIEVLKESIEQIYGKGYKII